ncbi:DUF7302 family protein [Trueperella bialowiezensis]|nr:hypothetical protein [Trueperella bialowiezensis]
MHKQTQVVVDVPEDFVARLGVGWEPVKESKPAARAAAAKKASAKK